MRNLPDKRLFIFLGCSFLFSIGLVLVRIQKTQLVTYFFLIWNLFLAIIPLAISYTMYVLLENGGKKIVFLGLSALWIVFYPNAPYIITDFLHLKARHNIPLWFDTLLIFSFAWNGFVAGLISVRYWQLAATRFMPSWSI